MRKIYLLALLAVGLLVGCTDIVQNDVQTPSVEVDAVETPSYVIPVEQALASLEEVLVTLNPQREEVGLPRLVISNATELLVANRAICLPADARRRTHAIDSTILQDTTLYIVNFPDSSGYAILSADERISDEVLVVADQGNLSLEEFYNAEFNGTETSQCGFANNLIKEYTLETLIPAPGFEPPAEGLTVTYGPWSINSSRYALVPVTWGQGSPFNDECELCSVCGHNKLAGCVAIAIAQILAANQNVWYLDGIMINWNTMTDNPQCPSSQEDKDKIAHIVRYIGERCNMQYYGCDERPSHGSYAYSSAAADFFDSLNVYANVDLQGSYDQYAILRMLENNKPVYISASDDVLGGHAWVIDGYLGQVRTKYYMYYSSVFSEELEGRYLMHCNFGWSGGSNGYYVSDIFNTTIGAVNPNSTPRDSVSTDTQFDKYYEVITYDLTLPPMI